MGWASARPWRTLALLALLTLGAGWAALGLRVDTDSTRMLSPDLPFQTRARELNAAFPNLKNSVVITVRAPRADPADAALAEIAAELAPQPVVTAPFAPATDPFFQAHGLLYEPMSTIENRLSAISRSANLIASLRADPSLEGFLETLTAAMSLTSRVGREGDLIAMLNEFEAVLKNSQRGLAWQAMIEAQTTPVMRVMTFTPRLDYSRLSPVKPALQAVAEAVKPVAAAYRGEGVEIAVTGEPVLRAEELTSVRARLGLSFGLSLGLVVAALWWGLGGVGRGAAVFVTLVPTLVVTAGAAAVVIGHLNLISVAFVVLMVGLGIDFAIHLMAHLAEERRAGDPLAALDATGHKLGGALLLTAASTALAFLAFTVTDFRGMAQLGLIGAIGVGVALTVALTLLPALVALMPGLARMRGPARGRSVPGPGAPRQAVFAWGALCAGALAAVLAPQARFDADPMNLRDPEAPSVRAWRALARSEDRTPLTLSVLTDRARAPELAAALEALPEVAQTTWFGDLIPTDQEDKLFLLDMAWPSIEHAVRGAPSELMTAASADRATVAARLADWPGGADVARAFSDWNATAGPRDVAALEARLFRHFPQLVAGLEALLEAEEVTEDDLPAPLRARHVNADGQMRIAVRPAQDISDPANRRAFVAAVHAVAPGAAGAPDQIVGAAAAVGRAMLMAVALALAAAALAAWLAVGRLRAVVAILAPVTLAGLVTAAMSVLLGMPFNYANVIVLPLIIGIGVDSGVHMAMRSLREPGRVFATATPRAVAASALTTIGAFATLGLSAHPGTASMGVLLAIGLSATLLMTFALTPWLIGPADKVARR